MCEYCITKINREFIKTPIIDEAELYRRLARESRTATEPVEDSLENTVQNTSRKGAVAGLVVGAIAGAYLTHKGMDWLNIPAALQCVAEVAAALLSGAYFSGIGNKIGEYVGLRTLAEGE
ncbi:hypothetical protein KY342_00030 [Candidatus Woesearchaeota archaeon]|nr:hypothetical protein [Candidatus Woesearchaeota archaeon]